MRPSDASSSTSSTRVISPADGSSSTAVNPDPRAGRSKRRSPLMRSASCRETKSPTPVPLVGAAPDERLAEQAQHVRRRAAAVIARGHVDPPVRALLDRHVHFGGAAVHDGVLQQIAQHALERADVGERRRRRRPRAPSDRASRAPCVRSSRASGIGSSSSPPSGCAKYSEFSSWTPQPDRVLRAGASRFGLFAASGQSS